MIAGKVHAGSDTTRTATQVCRRPVESGLGGHEEGVFGDDDGVESSSLPLRKRGRMPMLNRPTFYIFVLAMKILARKRTRRKTLIDNNVSF